MSEDKQSPFEQAAAFQKIWMESMPKMVQAAFSTTPDSVPPEILKQMRNGIFEALAKSWEEFMRSPQFLEAVKRMMDNAIAFKKLTSDLMTKAHHDLQGTARSDIDAVLLAVRHLEGRVIDRLDELSGQLNELRGRLEQVEKTGGPIKAAKGRGHSKAARKSSRQD